ncbi:hypothetical protein [Luteolibacter sp. LG18]|uniref:hypothetical protein n=1 Tax=Luteolibacter sp. LG18 TaxID=2819286 RepID=UPI002B2BCE3B|nr:hypothetical protein llg_27360 [Luteolibacter sp. LG18]
MKPRRLLLPLAFIAFSAAAKADDPPPPTPVDPIDGVNVGTSNTVVVGEQSAAIGYGNTATGSSLAVGSGNEAAGLSIAGGEGNILLGWATAAFGSGNTTNSTSESSFLAGDTNHQFSTSGTVVLGSNNSAAYEMGSLVAGGGNNITTTGTLGGYGNIVLGQNNLLHKTTSNPSGYAIQGSVLIGAGNETTANQAIAIGEGNIGQTSTVTLGSYNNTVSSASLIVGNGVYGARSNALVVLKNGNVVIPNGTLTIGSESALTPTSVGSYLSTNHYLKSNFGTGSGVYSVALSGGTAEGDYAFAAGIGSASGDYSTAFGESGASGHHAFATGWGSAQGDLSIGMSGGFASGKYSVAIGGFDEDEYQSNNALGKGSTAIGGYYGVAVGNYAFASGYEVGAYAAYATSLGSRNLTRGNILSSTFDEWVETEALFELGNGKPGITPYQFSNAITTLKNGRTTLTNKYWVSSTPAAVPSSTAASSGEALVAEGHSELKGNVTVGGKTRLKGEVILDQPQGDISMGIYE